MFLCYYYQNFVFFLNNGFKVIWRTPSNSWNIALAYGSEKTLSGTNYLIIDENLR